MRNDYFFATTTNRSPDSLSCITLSKDNSFKERFSRIREISFLVYLVLVFGITIFKMVLHLINSDYKVNQVQYMRIKYVLLGTVVGNFSMIDFLVKGFR